ncbi:putative invertase inhibitor [Apium graveolens]|uniref:putative invertase inhibitor n=1 Tax=Apium graveolens TaxID=4045 RepID=UPI003D7BFF59
MLSNNNISSFFFFSTLIFTLLHFSTPQTLIQDSCKTCSDEDPNVPYGFCTTSLFAAPASRCASLKGLGMISIRLTRYNLTDTRCHIKQLLMNKKLDKYVRSCLETCFELYDDALSTIKLAMKSYSNKKYYDANIQVSAVMDTATTCEDAFNERKGVVSPLTARNNATFQLSAIVLYVLHAVQIGSGNSTTKLC